MREGSVSASEGFGGYRDDSVPGDRPLPTSHHALTSVLSPEGEADALHPPVTPISNCVIQFCRGKRCLPGGGPSRTGISFPHLGTGECDRFAVQSNKAFRKSQSHHPVNFSAIR